jgi:hypothetical protein
VRNFFFLKRSARIWSIRYLFFLEIFTVSDIVWYYKRVSDVIRSSSRNMEWIRTTLFYVFVGLGRRPMYINCYVLLGPLFFRQQHNSRGFSSLICVDWGLLGGKAVLYASWARDNTWRRHHIQLVSRELALDATLCAIVSWRRASRKTWGKKGATLFFFLSLGGSLSLSFIDIYTWRRRRTMERAG